MAELSVFSVPRSDKVYALGQYSPCMSKALSTGVLAFLVVAFYGVICNVVFWAASRLIGISIDGCFCLEYCVVGMLALCQRRLTAAVGLAFVFVLDVGTAISLTYGIPITQCLVNVHVLGALSSHRLIGAALVLALAGVILLVAWHLPVSRLGRRARFGSAGCLILFIFVSLSIDYTATVRRVGHLVNPLRTGFHTASDAVDRRYFESFRPSRLPSFRLVRAELRNAAISAKLASSDRAQEVVRSAFSVSEGLTKRLDSRTSVVLPDIVLVIIESWGVNRDPGMNDSFAAAYRPLEESRRYKVVTGTVPFSGFTVAGESRELCGSRMGYGIEDASPLQLKECVPNRLLAMGYTTTALHGMDARFFNRSRWYRAVGFQHLIFKREFERVGLPDCLGAFVGTCDTSVAGWLSAALSNYDDHPRFFYWLTLNSHLPVLAPSAEEDAKCGLIPAIRENAALCSWYELVSKVHGSLAKVAAATRRPTLFVIVGDHAPPFLDLRTRARFSSAEVPYVLLVPPQLLPSENLRIPDDHGVGGQNARTHLR